MELWFGHGLTAWACLSCRICLIQGVVCMFLNFLHFHQLSSVPLASLPYVLSFFLKFGQDSILHIAVERFGGECALHTYFRLKNLLQLCIFESAVAVSVAGSSSSRCFQYCQSIQCHLSYFGRGWAVGGVFAAFLIFWRLLID